MKLKTIIIAFLFPVLSFAQSDGFDKALKAGEILVNGLSVFKSGKSQNNNDSSSTIESLCVSNKLNEKTTFRLTSGDREDKELIIPPNGKECLYKLDKDVWQYSVTFPNGEVYKKGEYNVKESETIVLK